MQKQNLLELFKQSKKRAQLREVEHQNTRLILAALYAVEKEEWATVNIFKRGIEGKNF
jgi:hypothetical protein